MKGKSEGLVSFLVVEIMEIKELKKTIWATAKKLTDNDVELYHSIHIILGLIFLKFITDTSDEQSDESLVKRNAPNTTKGADQAEYLTYNEFFVPKKAHWIFLQSNASHPEIGILIDEVIDALEKLNEEIKGLLPKNYSDPDLDKTVLGELLNLIGSIGYDKKLQEKKELLAEAYKYLLTKFAEKGKNEDQFYTTPNVGKLLVEMIEPRKGIVYDGYCGTGGVFVEIEKHIKKYRAKIDSLSFYGQNSNAAAMKIAKMNLILNNIDASLHVGNSLTNDCLPDLKAAYVLAWPSPGNRDWNVNQLSNDQRWKYGVPPAANANFAWLQHFIYKLNPAGVAGIVLPANSLDSNLGEERKIRQTLIQEQLIDCIVTLPSQLFLKSERPACLWILTKNKTNNKYTNAGNEVLFIDARRLKVIGDRRTRELTDESILFISRTYQRWKNINGDYSDIKGFCKAVTIREINKNNFNLSPSAYISRRKVKKVIPALVVMILVAFLSLMNFKNGLLTTKSVAGDTALTVEAKPVKDNRQNKEFETVDKKIIDKPGKEEDKVSNDTLQNSFAVRTPSIEKDTALPVVQNIPAVKTASIDKDTATIDTVQNKPVIRTASIEKDLSSEVEKSNSANSYKVISKAYFYNEPDEGARRNAFINHWNNSYAKIEAEDEKNGFIYVKFKNHLNQTSKGWLRKKDLKEVDQ